ncbi:DEAD-domain-containing protein [Thozetella sp. PMI_491]|nr:DEAD-domain-containing protein [Thozetella sp. PMI_491]
MGDQKKRKRGFAPPKQAKRQKASNSQSKSGPKRVVDANSLLWRPVQIPEVLEDAEGFYGLEEVEGVQVVRHGDKVQFITSLPLEQSEAESEEFQGFDDLPEQRGDQGTEEVPQPAAEPAKTKKDKAKAKVQKRKEMISEQQDPELETSVFSKIEDIADEPEDEIDMSEWVKLDLSPRIISSISRLKFPKPTRIQEMAIPEIMEGQDVIGKASTGSGKTLAFAIPIVEDWLSRADKKKPAERHPIALVLSPTRELAHQITTHVKDLCAGLPVGPYICSVTGGLAIQKQQRQLAKADIVIGTPGRLWEVLSSDASLLNSFKSVSYLVVDEADRLLTEGHFKEAEEIFDALDKIETNDEDGEESDSDDDDDDAGKQKQSSANKKRQTLVFSATFNRGLQQKLAGKAGKTRFDLLSEKQSMEYLLKKLNFRGEPKFIDVNPTSQMADRLKEGLIECGALEKDLYLYSVLLMQSNMRALVFANSISSVRRLTPLLQNLNLPVLPLHSEMPQKARLRSVERFTAKDNAKNATKILIATDVAARGLDIPGIDLVVHYHVPRTADTYVHRSGRTARAETSGVSILLCAPEEVVPTRRLLAKVHTQAAKGKIPKDGYFIRTIDIDRKIVSRLRERVVLSKKISDSLLAKERGNKEEEWMKKAAEDLGVDYDSEELEKAGMWAGRGADRKKKEKEAMNVTKAELGAFRAELKQLLAKPVNVGVSEKYLSHLDVNALLQGAKGEFLGTVDGLGLDDL